MIARRQPLPVGALVAALVTLLVHPGTEAHAAAAVRAASAERAAPVSRAAPTPVAEAALPAASALREIRIGRERIRYRATWSETVLRDAEGTPAATISATSYVREGVRDRRTRPVVVFFNGGPGASSSPLHFGAFGPRRRASRNGAAAMIDNAASPIDIADLLFIDPVGTGFSRELREGGGLAYWSIDGDPRSVLDFVREWLRTNNRSRSPLVVTGQSYGGLRAALMARDMGDLEVAALVLVSPSTNMTGGTNALSNDAAHVFALPTMAVAAWAHGKVAKNPPRTAEQVWDEARAFAESEYLLALHQGVRLDATERERIAKRIAGFISLPAERILEVNLRVDSQQFLETLLADEKKIVGRLDTRIAAARPEQPLNPNRPAAANDPALGLGRENVIRSEYAARYFRDELGLRTDRDYFGVTLDVNFNWDWSAAFGSRGSPRFWFDATPNLATLLSKKPQARILVFAGYYDLAVPLLATRHALSHAGLPADRVEFIALPGGHSPFEDPENLERMGDRLRELLLKASVRY